MNLDSRVTSAVAETTTAPLDVERRLVELRRTRRRRGTVKVGAALAAAVVVVTGVAMNGRQPSAPQPAPAPPPATLHGGAVLAVTSDGRVVQVTGSALPHVPSTAVPEAPLRFSSDGGSLAYAADGTVHRLDLRTGSNLSLGPCPDPDCLVAYNDDLTRSATRDERAIVVDEVTGGAAPSRFEVGATPSGISWSPAVFALAYTTHLSGRATLETMDPSSGHVTRLAMLPPGVSVLGTPAWAPSGHSIAFVTRDGSAGGSAAITLEAVTVGADPLVTEVHQIDRCACSSYAPGIAWAPDDSRLLVSLPGRVPTADGGPIWSVLRDGSHWRRQASGTFGSGLAWQPPVTGRE